MFLNIPKISRIFVESLLTDMLGFNLTVIFDEENSSEQESSRTQWGLCRISNSGYSYSCTDVTFPFGFTNDECQMLATRQRATNYLFHMYTDRGRPVQSVQRSTSPNSSSWRLLKSPSEQGAIKIRATAFGRKQDSSRLLNSACSSSLSKRKEKGAKITPPRRESLVQETEACIDDSTVTIMIRSLNRDLSPSARLERYLISLQQAGFLTSATKEKSKKSPIELDRGITENARQVSLRSKYLPHPPVYLFERAVKNSPFNNKQR